MIQIFKNIISFVFDSFVLARYLLVGGSAGITDLLVLYVLNKVFMMHYLLSATIAFIIAFGISFTFHKFWTFKSFKDNVNKQVLMYLISSLFGLALNTLFMYALVDVFFIEVILSQVIAGLLVACISFFISRNIVFKYEKNR